MADGTRFTERLEPNSLSGNLLDEIVTEILIRLPVKSICRFKCISKPWRTLLSSKKFILDHLKRELSSENGCFLLQQFQKPEMEMSLSHQPALTSRELFRMKLPEETLSPQKMEDFEELGRVELPKPREIEFYQIVDSIHGLVCIIETNSEGGYLGLNPFLWNPATTKIRSLPRYHDNCFTKIVTAHAHQKPKGFTFYSKSDDYLVVRIVLCRSSRKSETDVYSLKSNCWTKIETTFRCCIYPSFAQVFLHESLHWVALREDPNNQILDHIDIILSYDIDEKKFREFLLPNTVNALEYLVLDKKLFELDGSLAVFVSDSFAEVENHTIWVMKEYGNPESWTKLISFHNEAILRPLCFFSSCKALLKKNEMESVLSDLEFKTMKSFCVFRPVRMVNYIETLVSPNY